MSGHGLFKSIPFLAAMTPPHQRQVRRLAREIEVPAGRSVFAKSQDADAMFIVLSGRIKIYSDSAGRKRKTFAYLAAGDFFGEMALLDGRTRTASAQAVDDSRLLLLRKRDFQNLLTRNHGLALYMLRAVSERLRRANEEIEGLLFHNVLGRVAKALLELARDSGQSWKGGLALKQRYTQQELADLVGTTREPLTRALSSLRRAGLVTETEDGRYAVPSPERLAGLCGL